MRSTIVHRDSIVTIRADFQQGMESVSYLRWTQWLKIIGLFYAAATVIWPYHVGYSFRSLT